MAGVSQFHHILNLVRQWEFSVVRVLKHVQSTYGHAYASSTVSLMYMGNKCPHGQK